MSSSTLSPSSSTTMAAVDVYTLLSLPSSKAFSAFHSSDFGVEQDSRSDTPPRKIPRLADDSDTASASRSRAATTDGARTSEKAASVVLKLQGAPSELRLHVCAYTAETCVVKAQAESVYDRDLALVRRAIRVILAKGTTETLPATYAKIYAACQAVVSNAHKGEGIYENLKLEMERCFGSLLKGLLETSHVGVAWLQPFIEACNWFDKQVVSRPLLSVYAC